MPLVAAVPGDAEDGRQAVNHTVSAQDVGGADLGVVDKQLEDRRRLPIGCRAIGRGGSWRGGHLSVPHVEAQLE